MIVWGRRNGIWRAADIGSIGQARHNLVGVDHKPVGQCLRQLEASVALNGGTAANQMIGREFHLGTWNHPTDPYEFAATK
jgi:hypothetical protein